MAHWPCKVGADRLNPGTSKLNAPWNLDVPPRFSAPIGGSPLSPVIDEDGNIWTQGFSGGPFLVKVDPKGIVLLRVSVSPACTPAILDGVIYTADSEGSAYALPTYLRKPHNYMPWEDLWKWKVKFCSSCGGDPWAAAAADGCVVLAGKVTDNPEILWNDHVFGLDTADGSTKWQCQLTSVLMLFTPSIAGTSLVFADMQCNVHCLGLADGSVRWKVKAISPICRSTGGAIATSDGWVFHAGNSKQKKQRNAPFGGNGVARALSLKDGSLKWEVQLSHEANSTPSVCPCGPGGSRLVVFPLGANPGNKDQDLGDHWPMKLVALDLETGRTVWDTENTIGQGPLTLYGQTAKQQEGSNISPTACSTAVCSAGGNIYFGTCNGLLMALKGEDGTFASVYICHDTAIQATPAIGPNFLVVPTYARVLIFVDPWNPATPPGVIYQPLERSFDDPGGADHFWPNKSCHPEYTCVSSHVGPTDVTQPAWTFELVDRVLSDFFYNTAIIDAQCNVWVSSNYRDLHCIRPDGSLRGRINLGTVVRTPALVGRTGFTCTGDGYAISFDLENLTYNWARRYCAHVNLDSWSCMADDKGNLVVVGSDHINDGGQKLFNINTATGETRWYFKVSFGGAEEYNPETGFQGAIYNSMPAIVDDLVITCTNFGALFGLKLADGQLVWKVDCPNMTFNTGHHNVGPNGIVYGVCHAVAEHKWNCPCSGGRGKVRAFDARTGTPKWERQFELETEVSAVLIPKKAAADGKDGYILVVPLGNNCGVLGLQSGGDCWEGEMVGLDGETGEHLWSFKPPPLRMNSFIGNAVFDVYLPDAWGSLSADANGTVYGGFENGFFYAVDGQTGRLLSQYNMQNTCNCAPAIAPGMVVCMSSYRIYCWKDPERAVDQTSSRASEPPREAMRGVLLKPGKDAFNDEDLRPFEWSAEFCAREKERRYEVDNVLSEEGLYKKRLEERFYEGKKESSGKFWIVRGGGKEGGIKVREGPELQSEELDRRLATGTVVEEIETKGDRLRFSQVFGKNLNHAMDNHRFKGWVSLSFKNTKLLERL